MPPITRNQVRIIGGRWRRRKLNFPPISQLRPTPDRVRETLFSWLTPYIKDAQCLDLFAGSGALGLEALSRGARFAVMVDSSSEVTASLRKNILLLNALPEVELLCAKFPDELSALENRKFNIIFLDPPFHQNWISICYEWLREKKCLTSDTLIYVEAEHELDVLSILGDWKLIRAQEAGQVGYYLFTLNNSI